MNDYSKFVLSKYLTKSWSFIVDGVPFDGNKYQLLGVCANCIYDFACQRDVGLTICRGGVKKYTKLTNSRSYTIIVSANENLKVFDLWIDQVEVDLGEVERIHLGQRSSDLHNLHDVIKYARQIGMVAEGLIDKSAGSRNFYDKLKNSSPEIRTLYQASKLIEDSFETMSILLNPGKINFGRKFKSSVFQMFDKIRAIYNTTTERKRIKLFGPSHNFVETHQSIVILAHALLQNAIKYSTSDDIELYVIDTDQGVEVRVVSIGPAIDNGDQYKIFEKGFRGEVARKMHHEGMGVGLYVAQLIANAHNSHIEVNSHVIDSATLGGEKIAQNTFFFTLPFSLANRA